MIRSGFCYNPFVKGCGGIAGGVQVSHAGLALHLRVKETGRAKGEAVRAGLTASRHPH